MEVNTEVDKMKGEVSDSSQEQVDLNDSLSELLESITDDSQEKREKQILMDMQSKLHASIAEAEQARKNSEEFRKKVLQGVYRKEDRWDGK